MAAGAALQQIGTIIGAKIKQLVETDAGKEALKTFAAKGTEALMSARTNKSKDNQGGVVSYNPSQTQKKKGVSILAIVGAAIAGLIIFKLVRR